ncbi:MAG: methylmalonyl Co-A mutase-associated GTPase MeaB [Acidobacteria bacterium]|nr:methylmalonyl Co-A mutase-associated GTPase MeaB [Acidobacteriota bacterium]
MTTRRLPVDVYVAGVIGGDRTILARAITLIESEHPDDADAAAAVLDGVLPHAGRSRRVGVSGVPGVGKSTFIDALGMHLVDARDARVAVLSVDPSSPVSGGSILGDKTRMERLALHERAYIRPSPSRGHLGGVARRTRETIVLCEAAGFDTILVETVGVGQSETAVRSMVDFFLLLLLPGAGDELQGIKRGIVEMADAVAINKADGENTARAETARAAYKAALHLFPASTDGWQPPVVTCSATTGTGVPAVWDIVMRHESQMRARGGFETRRQEQALAWMRALVAEGIEARLRADARVSEKWPALEAAVRESRTTPFAAARELLAHLDPATGNRQAGNR